MKKQLAPYEIFMRETKHFYEIYQTEYLSKVKKADQDFKRDVHFKYKTKISREDHQKVQNDLGQQYMHFISQTRTEAGEEGIDYVTLFNSKINLADKTDQSKVLQNLGKLQALNDVLDFISKESHKYFNEKDLAELKPLRATQHKSTVKWTGDTKIHFLQLVYALHEAKCLTNEKNQITHLVKQVAEFFNFELGEHWQSLLSDNVTNRNSDYESSFFKTLADSYNSYCHRQQEKADKKKLK